MRKKSAFKPKKLISLSLLFVLLGTVALVVPQLQTRQNTKSEAAGDCTITPQQADLEPEEETLFSLINTYRTQQGLPALTWSAELKLPAAWMSADMKKTGNLSHTDSLGRNPETRLPDCGFPITTSYGENIAQGSPDAAVVLNAWKTSPPHNAILLSNKYTQMAAAMEIDPVKKTAYWTLDMSGSPSANITPGVSSQPTGVTALPTGVTPGVTTDPNNPQPTVPAGEEVPTPTLGPGTVNMQLSVKVKIQGIGKNGNETPKNRSRKIIASTYDTANKLVTQGTAFLTYDGSDYFVGNIQLGRMTQGIYFVRLNGEGTLSTLVKPEFRLLKATEINELPPVTLVQGDITNDNILSLADFNAALSCFQNKRCDSQEIIDFNDDGTTDVTDYNLLLKSFTTLQGN